MIDQNPSGHPDQRMPSGVPLIPGPLTPDEKLVQQREQERKATRKSDEAFQERQVQAVEAANDIAARNILLTGLACLISALALFGTLYQAKVNNKVFETAQGTLSQMKTDSESSSKQFQTQLAHYDAGLGVTQLLASHAGEQVGETQKIANHSKVSADAAKSAAETARQALRVSERAYITAGTPEMDAGTGIVRIPLPNSGHIPSARVTIVLHEATAFIATPGADAGSLPVVEKHWQSGNIFSIPPAPMLSMSTFLCHPSLQSK